jgi:hypothetical protein
MEIVLVSSSIAAKKQCGGLACADSYHRKGISVSRILSRYPFHLEQIRWVNLVFMNCLHPPPSPLAQKVGSGGALRASRAGRTTM